MGNLISEYPAAKWWHSEGKKIVCELCPRNCKIGSDQNGFCYLRYNDSGVLRTMGYERISSMGLDPIEKKPLYHVFPKRKILSIGTAGCNMGCYYCQNWDISKAKYKNVISHQVSTAGIVHKAYELKRKNQNTGIAFTYNEPTIFGEWIIKVAKKAKERDLLTVMVTNAYISKNAIKEIYPLIDAANIDLKAYSENFYYKLTLSHLKPVLDAILWIKKEGTWIELTNLLIPGYNDNEQDINTLAKWIIEYCGTDTPIHFTAFNPEYRMKNLENTPFNTLRHAYNIAKEAGLKFVYTGNTNDQFTGSTYCQRCGKILVRRNSYDVELKGLGVDSCKYCGYVLPGIYKV
jgi:pyruvate formate lyase activating enzyme